MLFAWIGIYLVAWACAYVAVYKAPGRAGFWIFYLLSVTLGPGLFGGLAFLLYKTTERGVAQDLAQFVIAVGAVVAALVYPVKFWLCRRRARR
ncbi:hypothetical protein [Roseovarius aestuariivivens]|uniref:hypothetical protein n=1 Tax=Roseovarius aestuariivivens TaxID=1888910 RepID=UPI0010813D12|nr:hypothetical protein [Roseovarius aestuariivivens]